MRLRIKHIIIFLLVFTVASMVQSVIPRLDSWNGTLTTGTPALQGVYTYLIRYCNSVAPDKGLVQTGTVLLLR